MTPDQFRTIRKSFGLTQTQWAAYVGVRREHIAKLEGGTAPVTPTMALLAAMYQRYGLDALAVASDRSAVLVSPPSN
jgi:predicted transcriptional regulator